MQPPSMDQAMKALYAIAEAMNTTMSRQETLDSLLQAIVTGLGYKAGSIRLLDAERRELLLEAAYGLSQAYLDKGGVELEQSLIDQRVLAGEVFTIHDVAREPGFQYPEAARREGIYSVLAVPLRLRDRPVGVLRVYTAEPHDFSPREVAFLSAAANLAARAIANAHLYLAFQTIAREVNSSLQLQEVLNALLRTTITEMNCRAGSIRLLDAKRRSLRLVASEGLSQAYISKGEVRVEDSPVDRKVFEGQPVIIYDVAESGGLQYPEEAVREGIRSVLAVPMRLSGTIVGVLRVYSGQPYRFSPEEVAFIDAVAELGTLAIENARLHQALAEKYEAAREDWSGWYRFLALS
jgi:GAF domain-containing protein